MEVPKSIATTTLKCIISAVIAVKTAGACEWHNLQVLHQVTHHPNSGIYQLSFILLGLNSGTPRVDMFTRRTAAIK